jgi:hypothetical protein
MKRDAILACALVACTAVTALPGAEGRLIATTASTHDLRLVSGLAPGIQRGAITGIRVAGSPQFDQEVERTNGVGMEGGIRYLAGWWMRPHVGWRAGAEVTALHSSGEVHDRTSTGAVDPTTTPLEAQILGGAVVLGPVFRIDQETFDYPGDFAEVEFLAHVGYGQATASNDGRASTTGTAIRYGVEAGLAFTFFPRWQLAVAAGYSRIQVTGISWGNTDAAELTLGGPTARLGVGQRF